MNFSYLRKANNTLKQFLFYYNLFLLRIFMPIRILLYTLYIMKNINLSEVEDSVDISESDIDICFQILSDAFDSFKPGENLAKNRRLAYKTFKDAVDDQIKKYITKK